MRDIPNRFPVYHLQGTLAGLTEHVYVFKPPSPSPTRSKALASPRISLALPWLSGVTRATAVGQNAHVRQRGYRQACVDGFLHATVCRRCPESLSRGIPVARGIWTVLIELTGSVQCCEKNWDSLAYGRTLYYRLSSFSFSFQGH